MFDYMHIIYLYPHIVHAGILSIMHISVMFSSIFLTSFCTALLTAHYFKRMSSYGLDQTFNLNPTALLVIF